MKRRRAPIHQIVDVLIAFGDLKLRAAVFFSPSAMQSAFEKKRLSQEVPAVMFLYRRLTKSAFPLLCHVKYMSSMESPERTKARDRNLMTTWHVSSSKRT